MRTRAFTIAKAIVALVVVVTAVGFALVANVARHRPVQERPRLLTDRIVEEPEAGNGGLPIPVRGVTPGQLRDTFTDARSEGRSHDAIDILAPLGTPVVSAADGNVEKLFLSRAGGNTVYVRSLDRRRIYYYAHLDRYAPGLHEGERLRQGDNIGQVGYSGNGDPAAPHLHFAIIAARPEQRWWEAKTALNPYPLLRGR